MAIADSRQARRENGEAVEETAPWSPHKCVLATRVRLPLVKGALCAFKTGVVKLNSLIWPISGLPGAPDTTANVVNMLWAAPRRINALLDSPV